MSRGRRGHDPRASSESDRNVTLRRNAAGLDLRANLLGSSPSDYGLKPTAELPRVWAAIMDIGMRNGGASIVAVADGSASMYTSTGGGMIGAGEHPSGRAAGLHFLRIVERVLDAMRPTADAPLPSAGEYAFVALTYDGKRRATEAEGKLSQPTHPLFPAFVAGHELTTAMRLLQEELRGKTTEKP